MRKGLSGILLAVLTACAPEPVHTGPSVLLITVDTLRADYLGCYGFPHDTSPKIDALAAGGVLFERALAGSSATVPSHASIFSSRFTREHSVGWNNGGTILEGVPTLPLEFGAAGYTTGAFVGNYVLRKGRGLETGFDVYDDSLTQSEKNRDDAFERIAEDTTERALAWLEAQEGPYFLWVHYQDPHGPYTPPGKYRGRFLLPPDPGDRELPILGDNLGVEGIPAYQALDDLTRPSHYRSRYADEIHYADVFIGMLVAAADHGESLGEQGTYFVHKNTTPEVAHVPFIVRAPGIAAARRSETVHHVDVLPTLLDLAGLPIPEGVSGHSLGPVLRGEGGLAPRLVYTDIGMELTAYTGSDLLRVTGVSAAWQRRTDAEAPVLAPLWQRYRWEEDGSWSVVSDNGIPLDEVSTYYREAVPMHLNPMMTREDEERLRALGYLDP